MTVSARNWAWDIDRIADRKGDLRRIKPGEKLLLLCLAEHENAEYGYAFPGQERIAAVTGQGLTTIRQHLRELEAARLVPLEHRFSSRSGFSNNIYFLNVDARFRRSDKGWMKHQPTETLIDGYRHVGGR